ncbi:hypothetical protein EV44_g6380 [Erysiphe necator]|uniref:Nucleotidyltransferase n=1 Tax=Uncinula necator TaxID=52586 RepID=A0A0B1PBG0_UNCNE|nr:hypothetical protein EV44_g6380 [Erysiphe necator]
MGGTAFAQHQSPISTPRMPCEVYKSRLRETKALLSQFYDHVLSPIEAPGKDSYGDLDILLFKPKISSLDDAQRSREDIAEQIKTILGAKAVIVRKGDPVISFAVSSPDNKCSLEEKKAVDEIYVQVDIQILSNYQDFRYSYFHESHGDLWTILNYIIKPFGLRVNNKGMYICIASIEATNNKKSRVFLTSEPEKILSFIGLDPEIWWKYFPSMDNMFHYAASCRMFNPHQFQWALEDTSNSENLVSLNITKKQWSRKDRVRLVKRPVFAAWFNDFIPSCLSKHLYEKPDLFLTREQIKYEVFSRFNVKKEFEEKEINWALTKNDEQVINEGVRKSVPTEGVDPALRAAGIRVLKDVILDGNLWKDNMRPIEVQRDEHGFHDIEKVKRWVSENWHMAGKIGLARQLEKSILNNQKRLAEFSL